MSLLTLIWCVGVLWTWGQDGRSWWKHYRLSKVVISSFNVSITLWLFFRSTILFFMMQTVWFPCTFSYLILIPWETSLKLRSQFGWFLPLVHRMLLLLFSFSLPLVLTFLWRVAGNCSVTSCRGYIGPKLTNNIDWDLSRLTEGGKGELVRLRGSKPYQQYWVRSFKTYWRR